MAKAILGIIGGSGVYDLPGIEDVREQFVATPWGEPSDALRVGRVGATDTFVAYQPRLEDVILPQPAQIGDAIRELARW